MPDQLLSNIPLFAGLPKEELDDFQSRMASVHLSKGDILFSEGDPGEDFYIIVNGTLEIFKEHSPDDEILLTTVTQGEYIGEMSLVSPSNRTASVRAKDDVHLLSVNRREYEKWLKVYPEMANIMLTVLSQRLDHSNNMNFRELRQKNLELEKAYQDLKSAQEQLVAKKKMEHELDLARNIQMSILPDKLPWNAEFDFGGMSSPARQVGGDFYDVIELGVDKFGIIIGDVADKGAPSAIFMARTHALLTAIADSAISPAEALRRVNQHILRFDNSSMFITAIYGILDTRTRKLTYARAGHEPPFLRSLNNNRQAFQWPHEKGMVLGAMLDFPLDVQTIELPQDSELLLFTDGLSDCRNSKDETFGVDRIQQSFASLPSSNAQETCDLLFEKLNQFTEGIEQFDDVTMLVIRSK